MIFSFFKYLLITITFFISANNLYAGAKEDYEAALCVNLIPYNH
jgi:hypothetical protein